MTIAQAFNEITVAQGGTPSTSGTITGAIDALNDALAGSDQESAQTIEDAVRLLGAHIGGGSSVTVESLTATENKTYTAPEGKAYSPVVVNVPSEFSTATLTVVNETDTAVDVEVPHIIEYEETKVIVTLAGTARLSTSSFTVPIIDVTSCIPMTEGVSVSVSGNIEGEDGEYYMTGDSTMTFLASS